MRLIKRENIQNIAVEFNTLNTLVDIPVNYFTADANGRQAHRTSQNYIVEVFLYPNNNQKVLLFDNLCVIDKTQKDRACIVEEFTIPDFSQKDEVFNTATDLSAGFWRPDGSKIGLETDSKRDLCYLDTSGNIFAGENAVSDLSAIGQWGNIQRVTASIINPSLGITRLNTQVSAHNFANVDFSGGYFYLDENAVPRDLDGKAFVGITSATYGSFVEIPKKAYVEIQEEELLVILRYFNSLTNNLAARRSESVSGIMDVSGGGRLNYRSHPFQTAITQDANYEQFTKIDLTN